MKKYFITLSLLLLTSFCFAKEVILKSDTEIRSRPSADGTVITTLKEGTAVDAETSSENSEWYEISIDASTGYIQKSSADSIFSIAYVKNNIKPFKSVLFWWIIIDKLILIGRLVYFTIKKKIGYTLLWILACAGCTFLLSIGYSLFKNEIFLLTLKYVALLFTGTSPFILVIIFWIIDFILSPDEKRKTNSK